MQIGPFYYVSKLILGKVGSKKLGIFIFAKSQKNTWFACIGPHQPNPIRAIQCPPHSVCGGEGVILNFMYLETFYTKIHLK